MRRPRRPYEYVKTSSPYDAMKEIARRGSLDVMLIHKGTLSGLLRREWVVRDDSHQVVMLTKRGRQVLTAMKRKASPKAADYVAEMTGFTRW